MLWEEYNMNFTIRQLTASDKTQLQFVGESLCFLKQDYPNFWEWYRKKVLPDLTISRRQIYIAAPKNHANCLAGVTILKDTPYQKKICTLYVSELYRGQGLGSSLLSHSISVLGVQQPLITVSDKHQAEFSSLFHRFGFHLFDSYFGYYRSGTFEHSYNSPIESIPAKKVAHM